MDWNWKKHGPLMGIAAILVLLPFFLISSNMMEIYQERINENPKTDFHRWLQLKSADICFSTMRPEMASDRYRRFLELYPEDEKRRYAMFYFASSLEDANKMADAMAVYEQFAEEYPDGDDNRKAKEAIDRLRYVKYK